MPQKSFVTPGVQPPYAQDMSSLAQEQAALQEALARQSGAVTAKPIDSGAYQVLNFDGLANALAAKETQRALENNRKKSMDVQGKYQQGLVESLKKFDTQAQGGEIELPGPTEGGQPLTGQVPGDQRAFTKFLNSPYPEVRAAAERQKADYDKRAAALLPRADFTSVQKGGDDLGQYTPKKDFKEVNGAIMNMGEGEAPSVVPGMGVTQRTLPSGTEVNQLPGGKIDAVDKATKLSITNIPADTIAEGRAKKLEASQESAIKKGDILRATEQALAAIQGGATTGYGAEWVQNLRTAATMITGKEFDANTPTAVLQKALAENVVSEFGGKLGTGVSNADVTFMGKATGDLATDAKAIETILAVRAAAALREITRHNNLVDSMGRLADKKLGEGVTKEVYGLDTPQWGLKFSTPEAGAAFEAGVTGKSYREVLKAGMADTVAPLTRAGAPGAAAKHSPAWEEAARKRMQELGLPYTPPGGR